jgi:thioester reductase-like protein
MTTKKITNTDPGEGKKMAATDQMHPEKLNMQVQESIPDKIDPKYETEFAIDVQGKVKPNGLSILFNYDKTEFNRDEMTTIAQLYKKNLKQIMQHCVQKKADSEHTDLGALAYQVKKDEEIYLKRVQEETYPDLSAGIDFKHIMVTGATGYLGAYLVAELLNTGSAMIYLPVRAGNIQEAETRIHEALDFYAGPGLFSRYKDRLHVLCGDLRADQLGFEPDVYQRLAETLETIIHPAANVKHYGLYDELAQDNVKGTQRLLQFAAQGKTKSFHYISTLSVGQGDIPGKEYAVFTEFCHDVGQEPTHIYVKSKLEAERNVMEYRKKGLQASIYRMGNLVFNSETGGFQKNIKDNSFYAVIKGMITAGVIPQSAINSAFDMSFINHSAKAVIFLISRAKLVNETYHLCNPSKLSMRQLVSVFNESGFKIKVVEDDAFLEFLKTDSPDDDYQNVVERAKLHAGMMEDRQNTITQILWDRTVQLLEAGGFTWPQVEPRHIKKMIGYCEQVNFFSVADSPETIAVDPDTEIDGAAAKTMMQSVFKEASSKTLKLIKDFNQQKIATFLVPGLITPEAGQLGCLLDYCFNAGREAKQQEKYKSFYLNSFYEALQGAIKLARIWATSVNVTCNRDIIFFDSHPRLPYIFNPLQAEIDRELVPGIRFVDSLDQVERIISKLERLPAAVILGHVHRIDLQVLNRILSRCKKRQIVSMIDDSQAHCLSPDSILTQLEVMPNIILMGENLTENELPFGMFSVTNDIYQPWNTINTSMDNASTCGGNRMVLTRVRDHLLSLEPFQSDSERHLAMCQRIADNREEMIKAFRTYCHPGIVSFYRLIGFDICPIHAHHNVLTFKNGSHERELLDCTSGAGVALRGHTPLDIVPEVIDVHDSQVDYWTQFKEKLVELTGFSDVFPSVSGSTAVDTGISLAMMARPNRTRIVVFEGNYAGINLISHNATAEKPLRIPYGPLYFDVLYIDARPADAAENLKMELLSGRIALVWLEVLQGQNASYISDTLLKVIDDCKEEGGYLVGVDEILAGLYRSGSFFSYTGRLGTPDIVTLFKGLSDTTMPHGVTLVSEEVVKEASRTNATVVEFYRRLYVNQLGSHISLHLLEKAVTDNQEDHVQEVAAIFQEGWRDIQTQCPFVKEIKGTGLFYKIYYNYHSHLMDLFGEKGKTWQRDLFRIFMSRIYSDDSRLFLYVDRFIPPIVIQPDDAREIVKRLKKTLTRFVSRWKIHVKFHLFVIRALRSLDPKTGREKA